MTIGEFGSTAVGVIKSVGTAMVTAITKASILDLIKIGVLVGSAIVTVGFVVKKLRDKHKIWKKERQHRAEVNSVADVVSDDSYGDVRHDMRSRMVKRFANNLQKKTKAYKRLTKKERDELDALSRTLDRQILGDDYDPTIDYVDPYVVKRYIHDAKRTAEAIKRERAAVEAVGYADRDTLPRIWHGMTEF